MLHELDRLWEDHCGQLGQLIRYADDFVLVCRTEAAAREGLRRVGAILARLGLELHPTNTATRSLLVQCLLASGDREQAAAEYEAIRQLTPEDRRERLRLWFEERLRQLSRP